MEIIKAIPLLSTSIADFALQQVPLFACALQYVRVALKIHVPQKLANILSHPSEYSHPLSPLLS